MLFTLAACGLTIFLVSWIARINDPDSFYHIGHARLYWQRGIFYREFPWVAFSVISKHRSDLWWGFHVLLSPLGLLKDQYFALRLAPAVLLTIQLFVFRKALLVLNLSQWWAFSFLLASTGFLMRSQTIRPQTVSCALLVLIFAALVVRNRRLAFLTALALGLLHSTLFDMILPVGLCAALAGRLRHGDWKFGTTFWTFCITVVAGTLRPGWWDGLQLLKVQLIDLLLVRRQKLIHNFGMELDPANRFYLVNNIVPVVVVLGVSIFITLAISVDWKRRPKSVLPIDPSEPGVSVVAPIPRKKELERMEVALGAFLMALFAYLLMVVISKRGIDQVVPFAMLTVVAMIQGKMAPMILGTLAICANSGVTAFSYRNTMREKPRTGLEMKAVSQYLAEHTKAGEIVFNPVWSHFPELFFWNQHNYYINGMDPIFAYQFDKGLYWKQTISGNGREPGFTGSRDPGLANSYPEEPLYVVLPRDFRTRWIVMPKTWDEDVQEALSKDRVHYRKRFSNSTSVLFEIVESRSHLPARDRAFNWGLLK